MKTLQQKLDERVYSQFLESWVEWLSSAVGSGYEVGRANAEPFHDLVGKTLSGIDEDGALFDAFLVDDLTLMANFVEATLSRFMTPGRVFLTHRGLPQTVLLLYPEDAFRALTVIDPKAQAPLAILSEDLTHVMIIDSLPDPAGEFIQVRYHRVQNE